MRIPNNARWSLLALLLAANIVLMIVLEPMGESLKNSGTETGIFHFELAGSVDNAEPIMRTWRKAGVEAVARTSIWLDFAFLLAYPLLLAIAGWLLAASGPPDRRRAGLGGVDLRAAQMAVGRSCLCLRGLATDRCRYR